MSFPALCCTRRDATSTVAGTTFWRLSPFYLLRSSCLIPPALWREGDFFVFVELGARLDVSPCLPTMELFYKQAWGGRIRKFLSYRLRRVVIDGGDDGGRVCVLSLSQFPTTLSARSNPAAVLVLRCWRFEKIQGCDTRAGKVRVDSAVPTGAGRSVRSGRNPSRLEREPRAAPVTVSITRVFLDVLLLLAP